MNLELKDHAKFVAIFMLKDAPELIGAAEFGPMYDKAVKDYSALLSRDGKFFKPPADFRETVIAVLKS